VDEAISTFLATRVLEFIREGNVLEEPLAKALNRSSIVDVLRLHVTAADTAHLLTLIEGGPAETSGFALNLIRRFSHVKAVREELLRIWQQDIAYELRHSLSFELLSHDPVSDSMRQEIREFVFGNLGEFSRRTADWLGGPDRVLGAVDGRLSDPANPRSKDWLYLCVVVASSDRRGSKSLITSHLDSDDLFVAAVAEELLATMELSAQ